MKNQIENIEKVINKMKPYAVQFRNLCRTFLRQCFLPSLLCYIFIELCSRKSIQSLLLYFIRDPFVFLYNALIIAATVSVSLLFRRRSFVTGIILLLWGIIGVTDMILLAFRTTPFTAVDFLLIKNAVQIMNRYLSPMQLVWIAVALIAAIALCVYLWRHSKKTEEKINYVFRGAFCAGLILCCLLLTQLGLSVKLLDRNFGNLANAFHENGLPYCFMNSIFNTGVEKPDIYSAETVDFIMEEIGEKLTGTISSNENGELLVEIENPQITEQPQISEQPEQGEQETEEGNTENGEEKEENSTETEADTLPNIIFLQLESFFDPKYLKYTSFSEDPVPYFTYLKENYNHGFLSVPSVGAGTANTEFEIITGMNLDFFGPGEYPYKTILQSTTCESMAYNLKKLGYTASAMHNNDGTFYERNEVFANLGFDRFDSIEYMEQVELNPLDWAKDTVLIGEILKVLNTTPEKDYIYTISVQGHGAYPEEPVLVEPKIDIRLPEEMAEYYYQYLYYVNQINEMDTFLKELLLFLDAYPEEVVVVMYGDHLPSLGLTEESLKNGSLFDTEYVIWSNFDLEPQEKDVEAYQLSAYVCGLLEIEEGIMTKYHQTRQDTPDYLTNMQVLIYDMLYGDRKVYGGENPYEPTKLFMGITPILISEVFQRNDTEEDKAILYLRGEGFTEWSVIAIDGEEAETMYLSDTLIATREIPEEATVSITVRQQGADQILLSETEPFLYSLPN